MDAARWRVLSPLLDELLELDEALRRVRLHQLSCQDPRLAEELGQLLASADDSDAFMAAPLLSPAATPLDKKIGPYHLRELLGEGGAGQVWLASHRDSPDVADVALKLLRSAPADPHLRLRFEREVAILSRLAHPGIPRLRDAGCDERGRWFLAMNYVPGRQISEACAAQALSLAQRLALFLQVCEVVAHAHARAVVHRDLKPSNILVDEDGRIALLDFGIARLLDGKHGSMANDEASVARDGLDRAFTLHYASPEQLRGEEEGVAADVYSLGVVLYELMTGCKPYRLRRQSDAEWDKAILRVDTLPPSEAVLRDGAAKGNERDAHHLAQQLRGDLDAIALKALQKSPQLRYGSVEALAQDLRHHQDHRPVAARGGAAVYRMLHWLQQRRLWPRHPS